MRKRQTSKENKNQRKNLCAACGKVIPMDYDKDGKPLEIGLCGSRRCREILMGRIYKKCERLGLYGKSI